MPRKNSASPHQPGGTDAFQRGALNLTLFGSFSLRRGDLALRLPKKAQGLLAYLALHSGLQVSRDQLATLLWGNTASEQARQSLRQCLVALRSAFGTEASALIVADTTSVLLKPSIELNIDVLQFEQACRSSTPDIEYLAVASTLYRSDFLADLHIPVEPFNDWVSLERQKLSTMRSDLLLRLSLADVETGDASEAMEAARELTRHDPLREDGHRQLMRLLAVSGQRSAALKQLEVLAKLLKEQLGIGPDAETIALADQIRASPRGAGDAPLASIEPLKRGLASGSAKAARPPQDAPRLAIRTGPPLPDKPSIVVLPFANLSGDPGQDFFVDGLVDDITIALGREKWLFVIASPSAFAFRDRDVEPREVAAKLGVRYVLRGSVRKSGNRVRVVVLLTDAASGEFIWSDRFEDDAGNVFDLNDRMMAHVAAMIAPALRTIEIERAERKAPSSLSAFELYLRAVPKLRSDLAENQRALQLLEQAIAIDPSYSAAYALAARCFQFQRSMGWAPLTGLLKERGAGFARLAVELGNNDSETLWMGAHALTQLTNELDHARALMERSLQLNPNSASAWSSSCYMHTLFGEYETAIDHFNNSQRLNPLDQIHHVHWNIAGMAYFGAERYEEADAAADKALSVRPTYPQALRLKIATSGILGRGDVGRTNVQRLLAVHPDCDVRWLEEFNGPMLKNAPKLLKRYIAGAREGGMPERVRQTARGNSKLQ